MNYPTLITDKSQMLLQKLTPAAIELYNVRPLVSELPGLLEKARTEKAAHYTGKPKTLIGLSELDDCSRKIGYGFVTKYFPPIEQGDTSFRDEAGVIGTLGHEAWEKALLASLGRERVKTEEWLSKLADKEKSNLFWNVYKLSGKLDFLVDGELCELKLIKHDDLKFAPYWFTESKRTGKLIIPFFFKPAQLQIGMWALGLDYARIVVVSREGDWFRDVVELIYKRDDSLIHYLLQKANYIHFQNSLLQGYIDPGLDAWPVQLDSIDEMLPGRETGLDFKNCKFCGFKAYCKPEGLGAA
jgi:hypothetical protein